MKTQRFILGTLIGAAAGVVAGVLTAPKSGKETRADIKNKAIELKDEAADQADKAKGKLDETVDSVKNKFEKDNK